MANFWNDILTAAEIVDEPIEAVMITNFIDPIHSWEIRDSDPRDAGVKAILDVPLSPEQAREYLNYEYDKGYGSYDNHKVTFWTKSYVFFATEYDGSSGIDYVKRNPS